jgi:predicted Zn-dependent peptidase
MLQRTQAPHIFSPIEFEFNLQPLKTRQLDNGISLHYISDNIEPVLQLELVFPAGQWFESQNGIAQATAALLKSGTSTMTSFQINAAFEQYGASIKAGAGSDWTSITVSCLTKHLSKVLPLVSDLLTDTQYPQSEIDLYIQNAKQRLSVQLKKGDFIANRKIDEYLFGIKHPYGKYMQYHDYDAITQDALLHHLKTFYSASNCCLFLAGTFDDNDVQRINTYLGSTIWNQTVIQPAPIYTLHPETVKKHRIVNDAESVQGAIRIASDFPEKTHPDFTPMIVLNTLFGGYFGSRLMSNIREDKGYTYGIHSFMYNNKYNGVYMISTEAGKDVCEAAIHEIYAEMELLKTELVSDEELTLVKNYLLGNILGDLDGSFQIIQRWKNLMLNGFTEDRFKNNIQTYKTVNAEKLMELAQKYYNPELFYELVVY